jgi:UDP-glucose 4-epimerase
LRLKGKSLLVTGGAGFIGSHLVDSLISVEPSQLIVVDNFFLGKEKIRNLTNAKVKFPDLEIIDESTTNQCEISQILKENDTDVVFHLAVIPLIASLIKPGWTVQENINMQISLLDLLKDGKYDHLVNYSSSEAYGSLKEFPMSEKHPFLPSTPYAASKSAGDLIALSYWRTFELPISVIRPFNNYGPRQNEGSYAGVVPITIKNILMGRQPIIHGDGKQTRDFIYVEDTARLTIDLVESGKSVGKAINISSNQEMSINEMIKTIIDEMDYKGEIIRKSRRIGDVDRHCGDNSLLKSILGEIQLTAFSEGIKKTVAYYKQYQKEFKILESFYNAQTMEKLLKKS